MLTGSHCPDGGFAVRASAFGLGNVGYMHEIPTLPTVFHHLWRRTAPAYGLSRGIRKP